MSKSHILPTILRTRKRLQPDRIEPGVETLGGSYGNDEFDGQLAWTFFIFSFRYLSRPYRNQKARHFAVNNNDLEVYYGWYPLLQKHLKAIAALCPH